MTDHDAHSNATTRCTYIVAMVSGLVILFNFVAKIAGYSETAWDWELLFLVVDGAAVFSLLYGVHSERAAFLQPFVALSIITTSLLVLLAGYLAQALYDSNSYAGQDLELEVHKRLAIVAHQLAIEFKYVVSLVAGLAFFGVLCSTVLHCWFVFLTVQCAKHFRQIELNSVEKQQEQQRISTESLQQLENERDDGSRVGENGRCGFIILNDD